MDFSSIARALESLRRRQPPLSDEIKSVVTDLEFATTNAAAESSRTAVDGLRVLMTTTTSEATTSGTPRWEPLAVGIYVATELLRMHLTNVTTMTGSSSGTADAATVYVDGPRVPSVAPTPLSSSMKMILSPDDQMQVCEMLHEVCLTQLEHSEPRVRTLIAKALAVYTPFFMNDFKDNQSNVDRIVQLHQQLTSSIREHLITGRAEQESTAAVDDTTGWRSLETNWLCLASLITALETAQYRTLFGSSIPQILLDLQASAIDHVNRHVRAAALQTLEQYIRILPEPDHEEPWLLQSTVIACCKAGLADNWSQVRMAASVTTRVWFTVHPPHRPQQVGDQEADSVLAALLPRMCLNRFYVAQGVKLYSHETWRIVFADGSGLSTVAKYLGPVVRYYIAMCDADNHAVREAACQGISELAIKLGGGGKQNDDGPYHEPLKRHVPALLQALLMCFHDESWPVRDEACLACGILCKAYPEECRPELKLLFERWTEQLTDPIWSVRQDAAIALGNALQAYGPEFQIQIRQLIAQLLPSAKSQPAMTAEQWKAHVNDAKAHENAQLYSCGSLAPKLKKKAGAGRIGCSSCGIDRPKAPWEATDGCIYLIREYVIVGTQENTTTPVLDEELIPIIRDLVDVCRVQHFYQSDEMRATLWKNVPAMAQALGKERFKNKYLEKFLDLLFSNLDSRTASALSKFAAGQCMEELAAFIGEPFFRGRLDEFQCETYDRVRRERERMPTGPSGCFLNPQGGDSPFGPTGLIDHHSNTPHPTASSSSFMPSSQDL